MTKDLDGASGATESGRARPIFDAFDGSMIGNGILPSLLHQDPRYFRLGHGALTHRVLYSLATNIVSSTTTPASGSLTTPMSAATSSPAPFPIFTIPPATPAWPNFHEWTGRNRRGGRGFHLPGVWPDISRKILHKDPTAASTPRPAAGMPPRNRQRRKPRKRPVKNSAPLAELLSSCDMRQGTTGRPLGVVPLAAPFDSRL